jgi:hypothetical protein
LWICPFGKTSPLPFWLYVIMTSTLPHMCSFVMYLTGTRQMMPSKPGIRIDVWGNHMAVREADRSEEPTLEGSFKNTGIYIVISWVLLLRRHV